eukprot:GHVU01140359.1.p3 GENE.GHVU01140359.1~~GHVU01140359.1.p3  ORF type:complete len:108 (-),score=7.37 GHVU01140359.1:238-561(-)
MVLLTIFLHLFVCLFVCLLDTSLPMHAAQSFPSVVRQTHRPGLERRRRDGRGRQRGRANKGSEAPEFRQDAANEAADGSLTEAIGLTAAMMTTKAARILDSGSHRAW